MSCFSALRGLQSFNRHIQTRSLLIGIRLYSNRYLTALPGVGSRSIDCSYSCVCPKNVFQATKRLFLNKDRFHQVQSPFVQSAWRFCSSSASNSEEGKLIYTGNLGKAVLGVKFFSYSSSMFSLCVMPYLLLKTGVGAPSFALQVAFCCVVGFFTFLTPVLLHLITKGYVVRLYHRPEEDTYTAVTYNALLVEKTTVFHQRDVRIPDVSRMFTSFYANGRPMLVNPMLFALPQEYNHLMGYDRPFTFDLEEVQKPDKS